jgi:hypothetical protein
MHEGLEGYYISRSNQALFPDTKATQRMPLESALFNWDEWYNKTMTHLEESGAPIETQDKLVELGDMGEEMLRGYDQYSRKEDTFTVHAVEGLQTGAGKSWLQKHFAEREFIGEVSTNGVKLMGRRFLVPILHPRKQTPLKYKPMLSMRIDLLVHRIDPGMKGIWIYDHKTTSSQPGDRGLDFDDQVTAYCYGIWRWLGIVPRGVCFNYLVKQVPKAPRILKRGELSTAKDQLTTPARYRKELISRGLMLKDGSFKNDKYADAYEALLSRGWDPFFKRHYVGRNRAELMAFEERLFDEYEDMWDCYMGDRRARPSFSRMWCPGCRVAPICQAMEDGSDVDGIVESRYEDAGDRKAIFEVA